MIILSLLDVFCHYVTLSSDNATTSAIVQLVITNFLANISMKRNSFANNLFVLTHKFWSSELLAAVYLTDCQCPYTDYSEHTRT